MSLAQSHSIALPSPSPSFCAGRKLSEDEKLPLWQWLPEDAESPSRELLERLSALCSGRRVSIRHLNRLRTAWGRSRRRGRPRRSQPAVSSGEGELIALAPRLSFVGVHLFDHWLEAQPTFTAVVERLEVAIEAHRQAHPEADFPL